MLFENSTDECIDNDFQLQKESFSEENLPEANTTDNFVCDGKLL